MKAKLSAEYEGVTLTADITSDIAFQSVAFNANLGGAGAPLLALLPGNTLATQGLTFSLLTSGTWDRSAPGVSGLRGGGSLDVQGEQLNLPGAAISGLAGNVRFDLATDDAGTTLSLPAARLSAKELRPSAGTRAFGVLLIPRPSKLTFGDGGGWRFSTDGASFHAGDAQFIFEAGHLASRDGRLFGKIASTVDLSTLGTSQVMKSFLPVLGKMQLGGTAQLTFSRAPGGEAGEGGLVLKLTDATIASQEYELTARGIDVQIVLTDPANLRSPPGQTLTMKYGKMGKWEVVNAAFRFALKDLHTLDVERTELGWAAGRLWTGPYLLDFTSPVVQTRVQGTELDFGKVVWVLSGEKAWGSGLVDLDLPIKLAWPKIRFGDGFVEARPGGLLRLEAVGQQLGQYLVSADPRFATDPTYAKIRERVVGAVQNFRFSHLRADMKRVEDHLDTVIAIKGKGDTAGGQELNLNLNVADVDWMLSRYLAMPQVKEQ